MSHINNEPNLKHRIYARPDSFNTIELAESCDNCLNNGSKECKSHMEMIKKLNVVFHDEDEVHCELFKSGKQIKCPDCGKALGTLQGDILKLWCKGKDCKKVVEVKIKE